MAISSRTPHPRRIKLRIMGSETEFGMRFALPPQYDPLAYREKIENLKTSFTQGFYAETFVRGALGEDARSRFCGKRGILRNQGQIYPDLHAQIEYATPECLGGEQLALYETAGLDIAAHALKRFNAAHANLLAPVTIKMYKTNRNTNMPYSSALSLVSFGSHANYLALRSVSLNELARFWLPFLQTRWCLIGNGWVDFFDNQFVHFLFSQRAEVMKRDIVSRTTEMMKPLICPNDEPHARYDVWRRLHDISGNANMSQKQLFLKYAVSDIVLAMVEVKNFLREPPHFSGVFGSSDEACFYFNGDILGRVRLVCDDGTRWGFLDVQEFYLEEALRFFREGRATLTDERKRALELWQSVIDAMRRRDLEYCSRFLDWAAVLRQFERLFAKLGLDFGAFCDADVGGEGKFIGYPAEPGIAWDAPVLKKNGPPAKLLHHLLQYIVQYADVETERSPYGMLVAGGVVDTLFTPEQIAHAVKVPPDRTRAHLREIIIQRMAPLYGAIDTAWAGQIIYVSGPHHSFHIPLVNPYQFLVGPGERRMLDFLAFRKQ